MAMRYRTIDPQLFIRNRANLGRLMLPNSLAVVNANDILPTNADGTMNFQQSKRIVPRTI